MDITYVTAVSQNDPTLGGIASDTTTVGADNSVTRFDFSGGGSQVVPSIAAGGTRPKATNTAAIEMRSLDGTLAPDLRIRLLKLDVSGPAPHAVRAKRAC